MREFTFAILGASCLSLALGTGIEAQGRQAAAATPAVKPVASHASGPLTSDAQNALVKQYCITCHSDRMKTGGLSLAEFDAATIDTRAEVAEKMIRKVRAGMMPPPGVKRPEEATLAAFAAALEDRMDAAAAANPNPGWRPFQRLNRAEYGRAVRDLVAIDVDVTAFLPPDTMSDGFDNVADAQTFSPVLMEGYLRAAAKISSLAVGDPTASPTEATFKTDRSASQMVHIDGTPLGTRGGIAVTHVFPADGSYTFRMMLHSIPTGQLFGSTVKGEQLEVSIDGERAALVDINPRMSEQDEQGMNLFTKPVHVTAGPHRIAAAFLQRLEGPVDDVLAPQDYTLADTQIGSGYGVTTLPHLRDLAITGPLAVTGISDTVSRRRIFSCRPTTPEEETPCATEIVKRLAMQAYRGPLDATDLKGLMQFYEQGRKERDFEGGVRMALQAILASPKFLFKLEPAFATASARQARNINAAGQVYKLSDMALASRLSFFLWGTVPDAELVKVAMAGKLRAPGMLEKQVRRMVADPRSEALSTRFASQWLRLQDADKIRPDALLFPYWDQILTQNLVRETQLLFDSLVREDRSLLDLLTADYSFINERIAKHYGIPNVNGSQFRRVAMPENRRGILGHGSILLLTSVADRTSPVQRGKWVMEVLLGTPPPPPPPNVPALEDTKAAVGAKLLSVRERMEEHRKNPACSSCHRVIDPLGLSLENYDVTGAWRIKDSGVPVDSAGDLYDGTKMEGPAGLRAALLKHKDMVLLSFTESLMTYALGRRVEYYDMPIVRAIVRDAGKNDYRLSSFIMGVVNSPAFQMKKMAGDTETTDAGGSGPQAATASRR
jgi:mono/diheme cytochrome c family protein